MTIAFKAKTFRLNSSHQYADQLWTKNISTIATTATTGKTDSVSAAYLPEGDTAIPTVFGVLSWTAPGVSTSGECNIRVFDHELSTMVTAASLTPSKAAFAGMLSTPQGLEIDHMWRISVHAASSGLAFEKYNAATGVYEVKHTISSD